MPDFDAIRAAIDTAQADYLAEAAFWQADHDFQAEEILRLEGVIADLQAQQQTPDADPVISYPADSGVIDLSRAPYSVQPGTDITATLRRAIADYDLRDGESSLALSSFASRMLYLPPGDYYVSDSIIALGCSIALCGAGRLHTRLLLVPNAPGFGSASSPKVVYEPGSRLTTNQGNSGFGNHLRDLTLEIGAGNPGAVAYQFDAANSGSINHVTLRAAEGSGLWGLSLAGTCGPAVANDVIIEGFTDSVHADQAAVNDILLSGITARHPRRTALWDDSKTVLVENFVVEDAPSIVETVSAFATVILVGVVASGVGSGAAVKLASGSFAYIRNMNATGYDNLVTQGATQRFVGRTSINEWATAAARVGNTSRAWTETDPGISDRLPIEVFPETFVPDLSTWASLRDFAPGSDIGPALARADASGARVIYLPYGSYTLASNVTLRNVERIEVMFSEIVGAGKLTLAPASGKAMVLENIATTIDIEHDGVGAVGIRHIGTVSGTPGAATVTTGPAATGDLFLEDWGPHAHAIISRPIRVFARQINREGSDWTISGGAKVWMAGDNVETDTGRGTPVMTVSGAGTVLDLVGGAWDNLGDSTTYPRTGSAVYQVSGGARLSAVMPGLWRSGGFVGHWVSDTRGGDVTDAHLVKSALRGNDQRVVMPNYVSP